MRFIVHIDVRNYKGNLKNIKKQMEIFLNEGDKVIYISSDRNEINTVYESSSNYTPPLVPITAD